MKNYRQEGHTIEITGQTTSISSGNIFRRTYTGANRSWIGVVKDDILGTSASETTIDGRPILIGDGVAAEAQSGDGRGDMQIKGVFTFALPTSGMVIQDGDPLYMQVASFASPSSTTIASGVTNNQSANFTKFAVSGALVGFAVGENYTATVAPFTGLNVVDVKLPGVPLHALAAVAP